jgi:hypothetical protein
MPLLWNTLACRISSRCSADPREIPMRPSHLIGPRPQNCAWNIARFPTSPEHCRCLPLARRGPSRVVMAVFVSLPRRSESLLPNHQARSGLIPVPGRWMMITSAHKQPFYCGAAQWVFLSLAHGLRMAHLISRRTYHGGRGDLSRGVGSSRPR